MKTETFFSLTLTSLAFICLVQPIVALADDTQVTTVTDKAPQAVLPLDKMVISCDFKIQTSEPYKAVLVCLPEYIKN